MTEQQREALEALESIGRAVCITRHGTIPITVEKAAMECFREEFNTIRAALSHAEGEAVDHWAVRNPGLADQFRAEAQAVRKRLGFESDADDVSPNDLRERIAEIEGAPQVAGLTETAIKSSPAYRALHREKEHLLGLLKDQAPQVAVPEGFTVVPVREFYVMSEDEDIIGGIGNDFEAGKHLLKLAQEGDPEKAWGLVADIDQTKLAAAPTAPAGELVTRCTAGLGCDEKGYCDAAATGQGDLCDRRTMAHEQPVSDPDGLPELEAYDAGLMPAGDWPDSWWQDYVRSELGAAHEFYQQQLDQLFPAPVEKEKK